MKVGTIATSTHLLTQEDFDRFAVLSRDDNPIHVDPKFSARTRFGKTVAHGMFLFSLVHRALDAQWPGARQISQDLMFLYPSYVGEKVSISLEVLEVMPEQKVGRVKTTVTRPRGEIGLQGETLVEWNPE